MKIAKIEKQIFQTNIEYTVSVEGDGSEIEKFSINFDGCYWSSDAELLGRDSLMFEKEELWKSLQEEYLENVYKALENIGFTKEEIRENEGIISSKSIPSVCKLIPETVDQSLLEPTEVDDR